MNPVQILMMNQQPTLVGLGYGLLYNAHVIEDNRNVAPIGCHIPTQAELEILVTYLGGSSIAGGKLKEIGTTHWNSPNTGATNESGFFGLGAGLRGDIGVFDYINTGGFFWTSTSPKQNELNIMWMRYDSASLYHPAVSNSNAGLPIRCLCDTSDSTITDIDGNVYDTVVIGTQRWLAQNLKVTKYRNGDSIPEVTDNSIWAGLTTGALCAYNNDWNNV